MARWGPELCLVQGCERPAPEQGPDVFPGELEESPIGLRQTILGPDVLRGSPSVVR